MHALQDVVVGRDRLLVVVLGGDFNGLQVEAVEGPLYAAHGLVVDPQAFGADIVVVPQIFIEVVQAVVFPDDGQSCTEKIS